jgi:hypothetical protein
MINKMKCEGSQQRRNGGVNRIEMKYKHVFLRLFEMRDKANGSTRSGVVAVVLAAYAVASRRQPMASAALYIVQAKQIKS